MTTETMATAATKPRTRRTKVKTTEKVKTVLYARGIKATNRKWLERQLKEGTFKTMGSIINTLVDQARRDSNKTKSR